MSPHILALDAAGAPHRWINVRGAALYYATNMVAWEIGAHEFVLRGGTQRATGVCAEELTYPPGYVSC